MQKTYGFCESKIYGNGSTHPFINWRSIMRCSSCILFGILFFSGVLTASPAVSQGDENTKIDLSIKNLTLKQTLKIVEQKADIIIMYHQTDTYLNSLITLHANNISVKSILD